MGSSGHVILPFQASASSSSGTSKNAADTQDKCWLAGTAFLFFSTSSPPAALTVLSMPSHYACWIQWMMRKEAPLP